MTITQEFGGKHCGKSLPLPINTVLTFNTVNTVDRINTVNTVNTNYSVDTVNIITMFDPVRTVTMVNKVTTANTSFTSQNCASLGSFCAFSHIQLEICILQGTELKVSYSCLDRNAGLILSYMQKL